MSRYVELIAELCSDGVEYRKLGDVADIGTGSSNTQDQDSNGIYPFYVRSPEVKRSNGFEFDETAIVTAGDGEVGKVFHFVEGKYALHQRAYRVKPTNSTLDAKFLYRYMEANFRTYVERKACSATVKSLRKPMFQSFEIPVPPIEVQREIVRILDAFAALTDTLTEELDCRRRQYAHYRDRLLSQESLEALDGKPVEMKRLGDVSDTLTGFPFKSKEFEVSGIKVARGINVKRGSMIFDDGNTVCWKSSDGLEKYILNGGDILIAMDGSLVGKSFGMIAESDLPAMLGQRVTRVRCSEIDPRFVFHIIASGALEVMVDKKKTAGAVPHVSLKDIQAIEIPVPSLATQQRIVNILDRFDTLTTSLTDGLPAEIEARKVQYAYYRDRLLDFPRKEVAAS